MKANDTDAIRDPGTQAEQEICINCGFCCDGTLFNHATLQPGEQGNLPEKMEENYHRDETGESFRLPCPYFKGKCSIYDQKKAIICGAFRCKLLNDFSGKKIDQASAMQLIKNAHKQRNEVWVLSKKVLGTDVNLPFRKLLAAFREIIQAHDENQPVNIEAEMLTARCNIFEALLIRYFRSEKDFNSMKMAANEDTTQKPL